MKIKTSLQIATLICLQIAASAQPAQMQLLPGHVPAAVVGLQPLRHFDGTNHLRLAIGLPLRDKVGLTNLLQQLYDSTSPNYHHYLTAPQFAEQFGPTTADYQTLAAFAASHNLAVTGTHPNRVLLDVEGSVADIEKALHVTMRVYQHPTEQREFFAPDTEPAIDLGLPVLHISGLDNFIVPHPMSLKKTARSNPADATPAAGSAPGGNYMGNDFRAAYVPGVTLTGAGQTVGLLEFDSGFYQSDITAYESLANLPNVPVTPVLLDGYNGGPGTVQNGNAEVSLDIEMAISMAPGLNQILVYEGSATDDILSRMATDNVAKQIGASWGYGIDATSDQIFLQYAAQGQSFFNASGDGDADLPFAATAPGADPNIMSVGGTTLSTTGPGGAWVSETVWNWGGGTGSTGGYDTRYTIPSWQASVNMSANQGTTNGRNFPDVAMTANEVWVLYSDGAAGSFGGTSCATPLWAGFIALVNQQAVNNNTPTAGFINPAVYALGQGANYTSCFHDITTGNNTSPTSPSAYYAVTGYDLCTGWGTPTGTNLINALAPQLTPVDQFVYTTNIGSTLTLTGYVGPGGAVTIPAAINNLPVTSIGANAFYNNTNLTSVAIPFSAATIGQAAFQGCANLTSVTLAYGLTSIGDSAFQGCYDLSNVTIPTSVTSIGVASFLACASFTSITIPSSVTSIGDDAFQYCNNLTNATILGGVTSIGGAMFYDCTSLTSVTIPVSVTSIGSYAFNNCASLANITIPASVTSIADYAIQGCASLAGVYFNGNPPTADSTAFAGDTNGVIYYALGTTGWSSPFAGLPAVLLPFNYTTNTGSITITGYNDASGALVIPASIKGLPVVNISGTAFHNCTNLTSITIPSSITNIGSGAFGGGAFYNCASLTNVTFLGAPTIGANAFENCASLTGVYFLGNAPTVSSSAYANDNNVTNYYLPGATGWSSAFAGRPAVLWTPQIQSGGANFGAQNNQFGFNINWASGQVIVVQACANLASPVWIPLQTNTITNGSFYFSEPLQTNASGRFYRISSP